MNDPVNYVDLFGLTSTDAGNGSKNSLWINNGDGTYTAKPGATLWGLQQETGVSWQSFEGYDGAPESMPVGTTVTVSKPAGSANSAVATGSAIAVATPSNSVSSSNSSNGGTGNASMGGGNSGSSFSSVGMGTGGHSSGSFANSSIEQKGIGMSAVVKIALGTVITTSSISNSVSGTTFGIGLIANGISDVSKPYYENGTNDYYVVRPEHPDFLTWDDIETIIIRPNTGNYQYVADGAKNARTGEVIKFSDGTKAKANQDANGNITYSGLLSNNLSIENFIGGMGGNVKNFLGKILGKYSGRSVPGVYQEENLPDDLKGWYDDPILQEAYRRAVHYQLEGE